mmetsp:Transcript_26642/g.4733  ORF Transcript_26642/g.4733 Transcript_26642/m.4733 type:complete len:145 (+) Transcript_26642:819-1253(+)
MHRIKTHRTKTHRTKIHRTKTHKTKTHNKMKYSILPSHAQRMQSVLVVPFPQVNAEKDIKQMEIHVSLVNKELTLTFSVISPVSNVILALYAFTRLLSLTLQTYRKEDIHVLKATIVPKDQLNLHPVLLVLTTDLKEKDRKKIA